jgi:hypothetical protein
MLNFPIIPSDDAELPMPKMQLREYAHFSELCLKSNPHITPANCLETRAFETAIKKPFSFNPAGCKA